MNLTEKDFIDKMIEIANDGHEYMDQLQCVYFTWNEFFNPQHNQRKEHLKLLLRSSLPHPLTKHL